MPSIWQGMADFFSAMTNLFTPTNTTPAAPAPPKQPWTPPTTPEVNSTLITLLEAHNTLRRSNSIQLLSIHEALNRAAQKHASWMAVNRRMDHNEYANTPGFAAISFAQRIQHEGYIIRTGGENIAAGQRSVQEVMTSWWNSPGHKVNILNGAFWNVGFGVEKDQYGHLYWCVNFATPLSRSKDPRIKQVHVSVHLPPALVN